MAFGVVLDACVLFQAGARDTLLRYADVELIDVFWSARILDEVERSLIRRQRTSVDGARRLRAAMEAAFDAAAVPADIVDRLEPTMTNDAKDRHVLAAAVGSEAQSIVTFNVADFPDASLAPWAIEAIHPDEFLRELFDLDPALACRIISSQASDLGSPAMSAHQLLARLAVSVPTFSAAVLERLDRPR